MSDTPPLTAGAWVDITRDLPSGTESPPIPFGSENDYMRMLKEAQRETSCRTSARVSPITSAFMSHNSPKENFYIDIGTAVKSICTNLI